MYDFTDIKINYRKSSFSLKKTLRLLTGDLRSTPLGSLINESTTNLIHSEQGVLTVIRRNRLFFVSRYLKLMISEEICGRFGSFDEQTTAYRLTRATQFIVMSDDVRSASLFVWFLFLLKLKHNEQIK